MTRAAVFTALLLAIVVSQAAYARSPVDPAFAPVDGCAQLDAFRDPDCVHGCWRQYDDCMRDCWFTRHDNDLCDSRFCNPPRQRCDDACPVVDPSHELTPAWW